MGQSAIEDAEVAGVDFGVFPRAHAEIEILAPAALAEIGGADGCVDPILRRPVIGIAEEIALMDELPRSGIMKPDSRSWDAGNVA